MDAARAEGNALLAAGDARGAEAAYSRGVALGSGDSLHLLLSNRSVARWKLGRFDLALEDAEQCVVLKPLWGKGYGRKGAALFSLGRFKEALEAYEEGVAVEKSSQALKDGRDKSRAKLQEQEEAARQADPLESFLSDINELEQAKSAGDATSAAEKTAAPPPEEVLDHVAETKGWTSSNQTERILCHNYRWLNCNPFRVLGITNEDATKQDVKKRYHKLSALVHPDKNRDDERAEEAFQEVKKAYEKIKSDERRALVAEIIRNCKRSVRETRERLLRKGLSQAELEARDGTLEEALDKEVKREFAAREHMRQKAEMNQRAYQRREREQEDLQKEYWKQVKETEEAMRETRDDRVKNWQGFTKSKKRRVT
ncbi:DnaJ homolog subfamily C member 8 [Durusdinium trenchii]|uniref:DnaJ homolog subfamily C member 8 n=1 Tax=Durusdinium trenchii TaxID=1381693 RepID=A0ABP0S2S6_9DINO